MKHLHVFLSSALLATAAASAATVVGTKLDIGISNQINTTQSAAIGIGNTISAGQSLAVGYYNFIDMNEGEHSSFAIGSFNTMVGLYSIVGGSYNLVYDNNSLTVGHLNYNNAPNSIVAGYNHILEHNSHANAIVAGRNSAPPSKSANFVVGNGISSSQRSNSFIVYHDGDIVIGKPQGDISMGIYGD